MPWLPEEWVATPFAVCASFRPNTAFEAPRALNAPAFWKILAFEEELGARELIDDARGKDGRSVDVRLDALMRDQHVRKAKECSSYPTF